MSAVAIRTREGWKRHIVRQLKNRDQNQNDVFQDLIRLYSRLLERTSLAKILLGPERRPSAERCHDDELEQTTGEVTHTHTPRHTHAPRHARTTTRTMV
ncbi:autophagy-related protein 16-2-like [Thalassophryne amazonica]|uniref:autophagy-related protein 16-2-like n=1 Tax=Thalassophryne amazonica TaxID=390379 RepID=UPI00147129F0|nr:autophagy-related protein 16-2-like [Thalassophryne amazonica]